MKLQEKTIIKLRELINEEIEYRSGPKLVAFFNRFGFNDSYGQGFPSRWIYTKEKLNLLNGTEKIGQIIKEIFAPVNFIGRFDELDKLISEFNEYLIFDDYKIVRKGKNIEILHGNFESDLDSTESENAKKFLNIRVENLDLNKLGLDSVITQILEYRLNEIQESFKVGVPLSTIFMIGSTLEGILFGIANANVKQFNVAKSSPKEKGSGKVLPFEKWTLANYIDVAHELNFISKDVKKFSHVLRDFRNYIHPYHQMAQGFNPDNKTAELCYKVLEVALYQIISKK